MKKVGIIPARYQSSRFPGKVLAKIHGKSVLQRVYERAAKAGLDQVVIATDYNDIYNHVTEFGGEVVMTSTRHTTGTERCAEALTKLPEHYDIAVNIQGDEPFIAPEQISFLADSLVGKGFSISTLIRPITDPDDLYSPDVVKVVKNRDNKAMLFSRTAIPYLRDVKLAQWINRYTFYCHLGIYAYKTDVLQSIVNLSHGILEQAESLEQLRWLEHGYTIHLIESKGTGIAIDTPEDLEKAKQQVS